MGGTPLAGWPRAIAFYLSFSTLIASCRPIWHFERVSTSRLLQMRDEAIPNATRSLQLSQHFPLDPTIL